MGGRKYPAGEERPSNMSTNLRGQLGLKSSALCPTSSKLTTQYMVLDHMKNHYSKITKAKSAVDTKPPKSMQISQKARDRKSREIINKTGALPVSQMSIRHQRPYLQQDYNTDEDIYDERNWGEYDPDDEEERLVYDIMKTTLKSHSRNEESNHATYGSEMDKTGIDMPARKTTPLPSRPISARSQRSLTASVGAVQTFKSVAKKTYDGDVLDKRAHVFTEEKPFTPRTLKNDRVSRLSQYKYYTPPKKKSLKPEASGPPQTSLREENEKVYEDEFEGKEENYPKPKPRQRNLKSGATPNDIPITDTSLTFETLRSRDFSKFDANKEQMVPPLDISLDTDHMKWLKDQASKAQLRATNSTLKSTMDKIKEEDSQSSSGLGKTGDLKLTSDTLNESKSRIFGAKNLASQRHSKEEEEMKYIQFMKDVTNDALNRGIFSDRALRSVFDYHLKKNRGILEEYRMREMLDQVRRELGISRVDVDMHDFEDTGFMMTSHMGNSADSSLRPLSKDSQNTGHASSPFESSDTYGLHSTGEVYSTIRSETQLDDTGLSDTQVLKSYEMDITQKDETDNNENEDASSKHSRTSEKKTKPNYTSDNTETDDTASQYSKGSETKMKSHHALLPELKFRSQTLQSTQSAERNNILNQGSGLALNSNETMRSVPDKNEKLNDIGKQSSVDKSEKEFADDEYDDDDDYEEDEEQEEEEETENSAKESYRTEDDDF
ncbi:hypothetical protein CHS0354_001518 [Potamilus streckersoni]|uniref:Spermatogenesis-associated protein 7 n=1 Tax=Potamilus streckersoni TaxID=2493646 RepID=A0AAE0RVN8_9BIVA|nr:hypothetical protein CHS0354_001518 [Potamilus streckersoni]